MNDLIEVVLRRGKPYTMNMTGETYAKLVERKVNMNGMFTMEDIIEMHRLFQRGTSQKDIAKMYNVDPSTIRFYVTGKR